MCEFIETGSLFFYVSLKNVCVRISPLKKYRLLCIGKDAIPNILYSVARDALR